MLAAAVTRVTAACAVTALLLGPFTSPLSAQMRGTDGAVDSALIVSVDVSESVDDHRYRLQMEGIAEALEDEGVVSAIVNGAHGAILVTLVAWADHADIALPWRRIASREQARAVAAEVRGLKRYGGEFTCLGRMFRSVAATVVPSIPAKAARVVVDVSGDGTDNCSPDASTDAERDALIALDTTINGLPIIEKPGEIVGAGAYRAPGNNFETLPPPKNDELLTLDLWYGRHVIGGAGAFVLPAQGYSDFGHAMKQKFVTEISALPEKISR